VSQKLSLSVRNSVCVTIKFRLFINVRVYCDFRGPGSSVGIATGYGLDGPGMGSRWGARFSAPVQTGPGANRASCGYRVFPGGKERPGRDADPSPPSSAVVKKS